MCAEFLIGRGWKILERNINSPWGEVDIICERQGCLWAVEVKTRWCFDDHWMPGIVSCGQLRRIQRSLEWYARECRSSDFSQLQVCLALIIISKGKIQFFSTAP
ncbi:YraN family protein [Salinispira pacifica]|uniref:YraN family protein n=1 Tax=Salinispira pacifica TaxID=1307761 RepID=UPI00146FA3AB